MVVLQALCRPVPATSAVASRLSQPCACPQPAFARQRVHSANQLRRLARLPTAALVTQTVEVSGKDEKEDEDPEVEFEDDGAEEGPGLSTQQVQSMLSVLCEETGIAEMDLKMGSFELRVRRSVTGSSGSPSGGASAAAAPAALEFAAPSPAVASMSSGQSLDEEDDSESLVPITAPKVGILRRGRYVKGKKVGKGPVAEVGDKVKKGQTLCYIEQLGTFIPVESPLAGEVAEFIVEEGKPVEYNQLVLELAPFFGGHIIGDSKYA